MPEEKLNVVKYLASIGAIEEAAQLLKWRCWPADTSFPAYWLHIDMTNHVDAIGLLETYGFRPTMPLNEGHVRVENYHLVRVYA